MYQQNHYNTFYKGRGGKNLLFKPFYLNFTQYAGYTGSIEKMLTFILGTPSKVVFPSVSSLSMELALPMQGYICYSCYHKKSR